VSAANSSAQEAARPPGRPRSAASHEAILRATLELLAEKGMQAMSMDAVAARAGVSKATIYRRWKSKEELVEELLDQLLAIVQPLESGDPREDMLATTREAVASAGPALTLMMALAGEAVTNPGFGEVFRAKLIEPRRDQVRGFLERAVATGELREDADLDFYVDVMLGSVIWRSQIVSVTFDNLVEDQARIWDMIVEAIGTPKGKRALARRRRESG